VQYTRAKFQQHYGVTGGSRDASRQKALMTMMSDALYPLLSTFPSFVDLFLSSKHLSLDLSACKDNDAPPCWANGIGHSTMERLLGS
jgi:hypothetical protein